VPASITLAQGILETESGNSDLVKKSNNHFGIKCKNTWTGETVYHDDDARGECFRKYNSAGESYRDHSNFLRGREHYAFLFDLDPSDYKAWAYGLKKAGYATNPKYPEILIKNIEENNLNQFSLDAISEMPKLDRSKYTDDVTIENREEENNIKPSTEPVKFNGLKAVYSQAGTSLLAIAIKYNIDLSMLLLYNDLTNDGLLEQDAWVYLEKKHTKANRDKYKATENQSIYEIAQLNGIQLPVLLELNKLKSNDIVKSGTIIFLNPPAEDKRIANDSYKYHQVQPREGLLSISRKYNVTVEQIKKWNQLDSEILKTGQKLIISK
jgi:LysM repeat protein